MGWEVGKRLDEGGVCASDLELKPDKKAPGVQEQKKSQLETFLPPNLFILLGRSPLGLKVECGLCYQGKDSVHASGSSPLSHFLMLDRLPFLPHQMSPSVASNASVQRRGMSRGSSD